MNKLVQADLRDIAAYERERPALLDAVIALKKRRRLAVGPMVTLLFENRETIRSQVQEMMRAERIVLEEKIQEELDVYNELLPRENELSATLYIEVDDPARVREVLDRFIGLDAPGCVALRFEGGSSVPGVFETGHSREDRISAVHFVKFPLGESGAATWRSGRGRIEVLIQHRAYRAEAEVPPELRRVLGEDLS